MAVFYLGQIHNGDSRSFCNFFLRKVSFLAIFFNSVSNFFVVYHKITRLQFSRIARVL